MMDIPDADCSKTDASAKLGRPFLMNRKEKLAIQQQNARRLIYEVIDAAMELSAEKGPHPLEKDCNCIACVHKRKLQLRGDPPAWKYRL